MHLRPDVFYIAFFSYLALVVSVGVVACWVTRSLSDYVLGGRRLGGAVAALSAGASDMSSWLLLGLPGAVYGAGLKSLWVCMGLVLGAYGAWRWLALPLRVYSEQAGDALTLPAFLERRFAGDKAHWIRLIAACGIVSFFLFYIASGLYAGALLMQSIFKTFTYLQALSAAALIIMLYTAVGGFLAVSWTDFFQGTLMLMALLYIPFLVFRRFDSWAHFRQLIEIDHAGYFQDWLHGQSWGQKISWLSWGLGYFGMPHILVRFMAVKGVREIPIARRIAMSWMTLSLIGAVGVGLVGAASFQGGVLKNPETVFIVLAEQVLGPAGVGMLLAAILSSGMCAIDSQMLAAASALTEDGYRVFLRPDASQRELVWVGRAVLLLLVGAAIYIARTPQHSIMNLVGFAWAGLGATFGATMIASLFWSRTTALGVVLGMSFGASTVCLWDGFRLDERWLGESFYALGPGCLMSAVGVLLGSLLDRPPRPAVLELFLDVKKLVRRS